jgi:hypothetical protein
MHAQYTHTYTHYNTEKIKAKTGNKLSEQKRLSFEKKRNKNVNNDDVKKIDITHNN